MKLLGRENFDKLKDVITMEYYTKYVKYLEDLLEKSRETEYYEDPVGLLGFQTALVKVLSELEEEAVAEGKKQLREQREKGNTDLVTELEIGIAANRQIARIVKTIADGLAWRVLGFDRPFLRMMAEAKKVPGSVQFKSSDYEKLIEDAVKFVSS